MKARDHSRRTGGLSTLARRVEAALGEAGVRGRGVLLALSGGLDSTCLVRVLAVLTGGAGAAVARLEVAHVDHGLRADSGGDAAFCRALADALGLGFHLRRLGPTEFRKGLGLQAEARRLRRAFLEEVREERGLDAIALGHHADDQAETVLFRMLRGTGPRGLGAMRLWDAPYVRPLLGIRRADLEACATREGWPVREDPSNASPRYVRNRIRHEVLPLLRTFNPAVEEALGRLAGLAADDDALLSDLTRAEFLRLGRREPEGVRLPVEELARLGPSIRRRVYLAAWEAAGCGPEVLEAAHLEAVDALLAPGRPHRRAPIPGPASFARSYGDLWCLRPGAWARPIGAGTVTLGARGRRPVPGDEVEVVWGEAPPADTPHVILASGRPTGPLRVRPWRPGDRVGATKAKDLLMEARLPAWRRLRALVVEDDGSVLGLLAPGWAWSAAAGPPDAGVLWLCPTARAAGGEAAEKAWCA